MYLFTIIDRTTRWVEAVPLSATSTTDCAQALFRGWIPCFGVPAVLTSDRGAQFTSAVWRAVCDLLGVDHVTTTAYHPEGNGMVERFHRSLKAALRARCSGGDWAEQLPWVLLGLRAAPREEDALSPAQAVFGTPLILPGQFLSQAEEPLGSFLKKLNSHLDQRSAESSSPRHNTAAARVAPLNIPAELARADLVLVRRDGHVPPLSPLYEGPYTVLQRSNQVFTIQMGDRVETVSTSRLKPCTTPAAAPALPPCRGRPPGPTCPPPASFRSSTPSSSTPSQSLASPSFSVGPVVGVTSQSVYWSSPYTPGRTAW